MLRDIGIIFLLFLAGTTASLFACACETRCVTTVTVYKLDHLDKDVNHVMRACEGNAVLSTEAPDSNTYIVKCTCPVSEADRVKAHTDTRF